MNHVAGVAFLALLSMGLVTCVGGAPAGPESAASSTRPTTRPTMRPTSRPSVPTAPPAVPTARPTDPDLETSGTNSSPGRDQGTPRASDPTFGADPLAFLDGLLDQAACTVDGEAPGSWLHAKHVPALLARIESPRAAAHVIASKSSILSRGRSSEGEQAMYLLACIQHGRYPLSLGSVSDPYSRDPEEYRRWWRAFQRIGALDLPRAENVPGHVDWQRFRPRDLIAALRRHAGSAAVLPVSPPFRWITAADAADLVRRVRSKQPLACVIFHGHAPAEPPAQSDEGATARMLLHLYRESLGSHHALLTTPRGPGIEADPAAWERWWQAQDQKRR